MTTTLEDPQSEQDQKGAVATRRARQNTYNAARLNGADIAEAATTIDIVPGLARRYYEPFYQGYLEELAIPATPIEPGRRWPYEEHWSAAAVCADPEIDPEIFSPPHVERIGRYHPAARPALRICRDCPVRPECLQEALALDERNAIRAGMTPTELRRLPATDREPAS